jgi:hypothetical protein
MLDGDWSSDVCSSDLATPEERFALMLDRLSSDPLWAQEYDTYVLRVSYAAAQARVSFADALTALRRLVK